jgi:hypothetical protein
MAAATTARPANTLWVFMAAVPATAVAEAVEEIGLAWVFSDKVAFALNLLMAGPEGVAVGVMRVPVKVFLAVVTAVVGTEGCSTEMGIEGCSEETGTEDCSIETGTEDCLGETGVETPGRVAVTVTAKVVFEVEPMRVVWVVVSAVTGEIGATGDEPGTEGWLT